MFDPNNEENMHEEEEEFEDANENNEEEEIWNDRDLTDFDYLKGIMQREYGNNEFSNTELRTKETMTLMLVGMTQIMRIIGRG